MSIISSFRRKYCQPKLINKQYWHLSYPHCSCDNRSVTCIFRPSQPNRSAAVSIGGWVASQNDRVDSSLTSTPAILVKLMPFQARSRQRAFNKARNRVLWPQPWIDDILVARNYLSTVEMGMAFEEWEWSLFPLPYWGSWAEMIFQPCAWRQSIRQVCEIISALVPPPLPGTYTASSTLTVCPWDSRMSLLYSKPSKGAIITLRSK